MASHEGSRFLQPFCSHSRWEKIPRMKTTRCLFGLEWVPDGRLFAVGGIGGDRAPTATVEMLECSWVAREGPVSTSWRYVAPLLAPRANHGVCYFAGKLLAVGGKKDATVECFTLPSPGNEMGEWTRIRPLTHGIDFVGALPFGEGLLCVGKHSIGLQRKTFLSCKWDSGYCFIAISRAFCLMHAYTTVTTIG